MNKTKIEWCDSTLNPVVGCTYGCDFCYARRLNNRFKWIENFEEPKFFEERLRKLRSSKPQNIFMDSMSDIADWEMEWMDKTFKAIEKNSQHNYLFLSKRPERIYENWLQFGWGNIWCGVTGTGHQTANEALYYLDEIRGCNTFLSLEPLLNEIQLSNGLEYLNWVIIGAETGNRKNKVVPKPEWVKRIVYDCDKYSIPVFMKESLVSIVGENDMRRDFPEKLKHRQGVQ